MLIEFASDCSKFFAIIEMYVNVNIEVFILTFTPLSIFQVF